MSARGENTKGGSVGDGVEQIVTPVFSDCAAYVQETFPFLWPEIWIVFLRLIRVTM
jgi:hypothetical protein